MINHNRVIKTTIFVVFLFVILSLPIFNKSGNVFIPVTQAVGYEKCSDDFNNFSAEDLVGMCLILENNKLKPFKPTDYPRWLDAFEFSSYFPCLTEQEFQSSMWNASTQGVWHLYATYKTYDEYLSFLKQNLRTVIKMVCNDPTWTNISSIKALCDFCKNLSDRTEFDKYVGIVKKANPISYAQQIQNINKSADCLEKYTDLNLLEFFSPGRLIRGIFASIAIGLRGILGFVADAFVWAFTGLPQKLGGYIHFKPIYDPDTNTGIWKVMQAYANLGIIIAMIFMAIATILRIEKYSWKKMLWKILLVALLINFSLVILGIFVDISNFLSVYFLSQGTNNQLGNTIEDVVTGVSCALAGPDFDELVPTMIGTTLAIILSGIFLFQFAGLLFYVVSRIITIWICAATSPFAFLGMAFDVEPIKKAVNMWRDRFTQAIVSLPILSFTLYFVLLILSSKNGIVTQINQKNLDFVMLMAYTVVIIALAQVLRFVAKNIGIKQIEQGYAFAQKAVTGAVMAGAAMVGGAALTGIAGSQAFRKIGQGLTQVPVLNKVGYKMLDQSDAARFTNIRKAKEKIKNWTKPEIMAIAEGTAPLRTNKEAYATYMAARSSAMEKGWIKHDSKAIEAIRKDIKNNNPDLNAKEIASAFPAMFKINKDTGKLELIDPKDVKAVAANIKKLSPEDMPKHTEEIIKAIKEAGGDIDEFFKEMAFAKTNQLRVFLDNVAEDEYTTGEVFGGDTKNPQPWAGEKGQIATMLKELETKAQIKFQDLTAKQVMGQATPDEVKDAEQEFYKAQDAVIELNKKLQSSRPLQETLNTHHI